MRPEQGEGGVAGEEFGAFDPEELREILAGLSFEEIEDLVGSLPASAVPTLLAELTATGAQERSLDSPLALAQQLDEHFVIRPHLQYLSDRITQAVLDVEAGQSRRLIIEMPPRAGKSTMSTLHAPAWIMQRHPDWPIALTSHDDSLATGWGRQIRRWAESGELGHGVKVAKDAGAVSAWETTAHGKMLAISVRQSFIGRGAKVLVIDDPHKDFVDAHSSVMRDNLWNWWLSVAQTRLEPPSLVIVVMTRWHEDDFVGRLLSPESEGDPAEWEVISLPALATSDDDVLGREVGDPLYSPLLEETREEAIARWEDVRRSLGSYVFGAMYQQHPSPAKGAIFDSSWWRFWTSDPERVTEDGRVTFLDTSAYSSPLKGARWLDSWDCSFKGGGTGAATSAKVRGSSAGTSWVVGQRWARTGPNRYLIAQQRGRWSFTQTLDRMKIWARPDSPLLSPWGHLVHERLVEERANGAAIIDTLRQTLSGVKPTNPTISKEARAHAITPEMESGHVYFPHPSEPGCEWVPDFLSELRNFPHDAHDDQVDTLTQALAGLREHGRGGVSVPGQARGAPGRQHAPRDLVRAALTDLSRPLPGSPLRRR